MALIIADLCKVWVAVLLQMTMYDEAMMRHDDRCQVDLDSMEQLPTPSSPAALLAAIQRPCAGSGEGITLHGIILSPSTTSRQSVIQNMLGITTHIEHTSRCLHNEYVGTNFISICFLNNLETQYHWL